MTNQFSRTEMLIGTEAAQRLQTAHVAVFGLGGVGAYAAEALARAGVGEITVVDSDTVSLTNLNRQLLALHSTLGQKKTLVQKNRILEINPRCTVHDRDLFFTAETADQIDFSAFDYVADCIDTVASKLLLAEICREKSIPLISSMGTGNKTDAAGFQVSDISKTSGCPLARVMRKELRKRDIRHLTVVYSPVEPMTPVLPCEEQTSSRQIPGTVSYVPGVAGLLLAGHILQSLWQEERP